VAINIDELLETLRRTYPTSLVRILPEPAMFLRSDTGRTFHAEGMQVLSVESALAYASAYMAGLQERILESADHKLDAAHPWIIGLHAGDLTTSPLLFIFGNIIRGGHEHWIELGYPRYEKLEFPH
jgi:hypothetical protein